MELLISTILATPFGLLFIFTGLIVNLIQVTCFVFVWPLSKSMFRRINGVVVEILWLEYLCIMQWWAGIKVQLFTDSETSKLLGKENALVIPNHRHDVDFLVVWILAQHFGCLGSAPVVSRASLKFLPVLGWATWFSGYVYLEKKWSKGQAILKSSVQALKDFKRPFWLILFVEGTRFNPNKLLAAQEYSVSLGLPIPKNVLLPQTKGFVSAVKHMRSFVPAVYDVTLAVPQSEPPPSMLGVLKRKSSVYEVHIKRYLMEELLESDEGIAEWCRDRYVVKDAFMDKFLAKGTYGDQKYHEFRPNKKSLFVTIFWLCALLASIYKLCQRFSPLSSWKGIGLSALTLALSVTVMYSILLPAQRNKTTPKKEATSKMG